MKPKLFAKILAVMLGTLLLIPAFAPIMAKAEPNKDVFRLQSSIASDGNFGFSYSGGEDDWRLSEYYVDGAFSGMVRHQYNNELSAKAKNPYFTFVFRGTSLALYGTKISNGSIAKVTLDGKEQGEIDYYSEFIQRQTLLFQLTNLTDTQHTLRVELTPNKNPAADQPSLRFGSVSFAEVTAPGAQFQATDFSAQSYEVVLAPGAAYPIEWDPTPLHANVFPAITYRSTDPSVAKVDKNGVITALNEGVTTVCYKASYPQVSGEITVAVVSPSQPFAARAGDGNFYTGTEKYYSEWAKPLKYSDYFFKNTAFLSDTVTAKLDILTAGTPIEITSVTANGFENTRGNTLPDDCLKVYTIEEVTNYDSNQKIPDILVPFSGSLSLPAHSLRSFWLEINTPAQAAPGFYRGTINITTAQGGKATLGYALEIIALPCPALSSADNGFLLELSQYPYSSNRYFSGKSTEAYFGTDLTGVYLNDDYQKQLKAQVSMYAQAGGTAVTVTVTENPFNAQTPDPYPSMVKWTLEKDGAFSFDYTDFDKWINLNDACGVTGPIKSFSIAPKGNEITYKDAQTGKAVTRALTPGTAEWQDIWKQFLTDYMRHTTQNGWFNRVYMALEERTPEEIGQVLDLISSVKNSKGESFKTSLAVPTLDAQALFPRIDDLSLPNYLKPKELLAFVEPRRKEGKTTTLHIPKARQGNYQNEPGQVLFSVWNAAKDADGLYNWALDAYTANPVFQAHNTQFPAGSLYLFYPAPADSQDVFLYSSVRFEKLKEGMRDLAKLNYLQKNFPDIGNLFQISQAASSKISSNSSDYDVSKAKDALATAAREAQLAVLIKKAEKLPAAEGLADAIKEAKRLQLFYQTSTELSPAAHRLYSYLPRPLSEEESFMKNNFLVPLFLLTLSTCGLAGILYTLNRPGKKQKKKGKPQS